jgi:UDP-GlcNAc:undecaprenyl-phosphate/decaprenyl-phosphate GlcNAc-1-phosphate transferase
MLVDGRPDPIFALYAFCTAAVIAWTLVPLAERLARRIGAIDVPNERSIHTEPTPKLGGLAILIGILISAVLFMPMGDETRGILIGAATIALVGVIDDVVTLGATPKLAGQILAASVAVFSGVRLTAFTLPFVGGVDPTSVELLDLPIVGEVDLGELLGLIGIVAAINVINFIDGVDGLAAGVCVISAATLSIIALSLGRETAGVLAALTAGGALGFLRHGFPPASSFMGDTGSNLLGYMLAVIAIQGSLKTNAVVALFFPLIILAVPILDTGFVVAKRVKYRQPIYRADRWHFHHRMANIGFSQRRTLAYLYGWTAMMALLALALRFVPYSDDRGNFDPFWTAVIVACFLAVVAASFYLVVTLEILKLRRFHATPNLPPEVVDEGVKRELETGSFEIVNPATGEYQSVDPETGEFEAVDPGRA